MDRSEIAGYRWTNAALNTSHDYLLPTLLRELERLQTEVPVRGRRRIFELGCGNGSVANVLSQRGWEVTGVDPSREGIAQANTQYPHLKLHEGSAYEDLSSRYVCLLMITSLEVVEHVYAPRQYAATFFDILELGGTAIISTPYHGYWKNLAMALTGKLDAHFTALWDHGHIKFWSIWTLSELLREAGFIDIRFKRVGRIPVLAKRISGTENA